MELIAFIILLSILFLFIVVNLGVLLVKCTRASISIIIILIAYLMLFFDLIYVLETTQYSDSFFWYTASFHISVIIFIIIPTVYTIILFIKNKNIVLLLFLVFPILSFPLAFDKVDKYIILKDTLNKSKYELKSFLKTFNENNEYTIKNEEFVSIKNENNMYGLELKTNIGKTLIGDRWDSWATIIYDDTGIIENAVPTINNEFNGVAKYEKLNNIFGGRIFKIVKLDKNWYLCYYGLSLKK
ncbi:MAG: hypothetical protein LBK73_10835 [Treponema sp.]|jgi:hypothetical protein|nr:hypothetical protein [Treponema sp.]